MASLDDVNRAIDSDEPDYPALAQELGEEALPQLQALVAEDERRIASKAAYLAAVIGGAGSKDVVDRAAQSKHDVVRAAAAAALRFLPAEEATDIADRLLGDPDVAVRARAAKSAADVDSPELAGRLRRMAEEDDDESVRNLARRLADRAEPRR
jgi:HEAT repeat protein